MKQLLRPEPTCWVAVVLSLALAQIAAQSPDSDAEKITFEVASIRPSSPGETRRGTRLLPGGRSETVGTPLQMLIRMAYGGDTIQLPEQIVGGPAWIGSQGFDVVAIAKGEAGFDAAGYPRRFEVMLRALLAERFNLRVHREIRQVPIYVLTKSNRDGKLGPQLHESDANCYAARPAQGAPAAPRRSCGVRGGPGNITGAGVTMPELAASFAAWPIVGRPVIDRTGLTGQYDLKLESVGTIVPGPNPTPAITNSATDVGPNLFTALQEQLGLKLEPDKGPVEFLVVDHAELPSEN
jgi:uncharacterized protein (TIGR03435 family)